LDDSLDLFLGDESTLRIFTSEATFASVQPEDVPAESLSLLPKFQNSILVEFPDKQMHWYLLAQGLTASSYEQEFLALTEK
jgi:hypothetical protein